MPVYLKERIKEGWRAKDNKREGPCLVAVMCDAKNNKEMFHYAPNLVDKPFWLQMFKDLEVLDELNKARVKAYDVLANLDEEVKKFTKKVNSSQTTIDWNNTCRLKNEEREAEAKE